VAKWLTKLLNQSQFRGYRHDRHTVERNSKGGESEGLREHSDNLRHLAKVITDHIGKDVPSFFVEIDPTD
jgi:hypothetical protein